MNEQDLKQKLLEKPDTNYNSCVQEWLALDPTEMIEKAGKIAATSLVYKELRNGGCNADYLEYLLRFQNPLEVVRDQWLNEQGTVLNEDMGHVLWTLADTRNAEQDYELGEAFREPGQDEGVRMC
ncbi:MAG: DUF3848 domain-containing protein [Firmicutes bacterium]|nr:DUF3848 domain-containing protein [Bacillota bacterium]